jgi:hypothetical protein
VCQSIHNPLGKAASPWPHLGYQPLGTTMQERRGISLQARDRKLLVSATHDGGGPGVFRPLELPRNTHPPAAACVAAPPPCRPTYSTPRIVECNRSQDMPPAATRKSALPASLLGRSNSGLRGSAACVPTVHTAFIMTLLLLQLSADESVRTSNQKRPICTTALLSRIYAFPASAAGVVERV